MLQARPDLSSYGVKKTTGLRKARSHMIIKALSEGESERGNIKVIMFGGCGGERLEFYYRDTLIMVYYLAVPRALYEVQNGFEATASTKNQRNMARQAIAEVFEGAPV